MVATGFGKVSILVGVNACHAERPMRSRNEGGPFAWLGVLAEAVAAVPAAVVAG